MAMWKLRRTRPTGAGAARSLGPIRSQPRRIRSTRRTSFSRISEAVSESLYLEESLEAIVKTTMGAVQATGAALVLEDGRIAWPEGKPGAYAVRTPLRWKRREIGQLVADRDRPFTDEERALLEAIAHHAAVALEHGRAVMRGVLAQEIHHRVKNNLQTVASLLRLQAHAEGVDPREALEHSVNRILAIAAVHESLTEQREEDVDLAELIDRLRAMLVQGLGGGRDVQAQLEPVSLAGTRATAPAPLSSQGSLMNDTGGPAPDRLDSTATLLRRFRQGDLAARDAILARYAPALRRWAQGRLPARARGLVDTDDLVQITLLRALGRLKEFEPRREGAFLAYLRSILLNQIREELRRALRRPRQEEIDEESLRDCGPSPLERAKREPTRVPGLRLHRASYLPPARRDSRTARRRHRRSRPGVWPISPMHTALVLPAMPDRLATIRT